MTIAAAKSVRPAASIDPLDGEGRQAAARNYIDHGDYLLEFREVAWFDGTGHTGTVGPLFTFRVVEASSDAVNRVGSEVTTLPALSRCTPEQREFRLGTIDQVLQAISADPRSKDAGFEYAGPEDRKLLRDDPAGFSSSCIGLRLRCSAVKTTYTPKRGGTEKTVTRLTFSPA